MWLEKVEIKGDASARQENAYWGRGSDLSIGAAGIAKTVLNENDNVGRILYQIRRLMVIKMENFVTKINNYSNLI